MSERPAEVEAGDAPIIRGESFESFYARQQRRLVGLAFSVSGSRLGAEDLAQDALAAAYRDWDRIQRWGHARRRSHLRRPVLVRVVGVDRSFVAQPDGCEPVLAGQQNHPFPRDALPHVAGSRDDSHWLCPALCPRMAALRNRDMTMY